MKRVYVTAAILLFSLSPLVFGQSTADTTTSWLVDVLMNYSVVPNITYSTADNYECKLDLYARRNSPTPVPVVVFIHGGGWVGGVKESGTFWLLPWIKMGFSVVNIEYRLARVALAPAAVEDCRLALRWVMKNSRMYNFDSSRVVITGASAGGHLALITGMLDSTAGFDAPKEWDQTNPTMRVAAIVNWFGITDVKDLLSGTNRQNYAVSWLGSLPNREAIADRVSPLTYVRKGLPPVLSIHGTNDNLVPYSHATRLHQALDRAGVSNQLVTIPDGKHGGFTRDQTLMIFSKIHEFLQTHRIVATPTTR